MKEYKYEERASDEFHEFFMESQRNTVGGSANIPFKEDGKQLFLNIDCFWEKSLWFNYSVTDEDDNIIEQQDLVSF